jgi:hypothetical protein
MVERKITMSEKADFLQIREFSDGTYSVVARVWVPEKKFYEHPTLINLTKEEAQRHVDIMLKSPPTLKEVLDTWKFIGD